MKIISINKKGNLIYVILIMILINVNLHAQDSDADLCRDEKGIVYSYNQLLVDALFLCYRNYISPVNQSSCPMYPTCSGYAEECFKINSPLLAGLKTCDRLIRCSNDLHNYDPININGMIRYNDPVVFGINMPRDLHLGSIAVKNEESAEESFISKKNVDELLYWFAKQLEVNKEFNSAIIEYKRLISYYPDSIYVPRAKSDVFNILFNTGQYLEAINWGKDLLYNKNKDGIDEVNITYYISLGYFKIGNYKLSREFLSKVRNQTISNKLRDKTILLEGLSFAYEEEWEQAKAVFIDISATSDYYELAIQYIDLAQQGARLKKKNPKTAAILSIIPGLGYLYCGYPKTAISSFSVNGLLMWGTKSAFEEDNRGLGIFLGGMSLGLYAGNIYGPYHTAEEKNKKMVQDHLNKFSLDFLD